MAGTESVSAEGSYVEGVSFPASTRLSARNEALRRTPPYVAADAVCCPEDILLMTIAPKR